MKSRTPHVSVLINKLLVVIAGFLIPAAQAVSGDAHTPFGLGQLLITEFMTIDSTLADEDGDLSDWIEIFNTGAVDINLKGWHLTDSAIDLTKWTFPEVIIPASGHIVVFASQKDRRDPSSQLHTNFRLSAEGEYLALIEPDGATVAHEYAPQYPNQNAPKEGFSYGLAMDVSGTISTSDRRFFKEPTPGSANSAGVIGFVIDTKFSVGRGFYDDPFEVTIATDTPGAIIWHTTDATTPTPTNGNVYTGPIQISKTTALRAAAFKTDFEPSNVVTHTYIFLNDVVKQTRPLNYPTRWGGGVAADYDMDPDVVNHSLYKNTIKDDLKSLPTMSIVTDPPNLFDPRTGIYVNPERKGVAWERPTSTELIYPDGRKGFQINNGIRIQGGYSRIPDRKKHSFRLLFKRKYGPPTLRYRLFNDSPVDRFDTIVLRGNYNYTWHSHEGGFGSSIGKAEYMRDEFSRRTQLAAGQPSSHGTFVHLYLNGLYWGVYNVCERPDDSFSAEYLGGEKEEYDVITGGTRNVYTTQVKGGNKQAWSKMMSLAEAGGFENNDKYQAIQKYLDVDNLIDYMLVIYYTGNRDAPTIIGGGGTPWNFYSSRRRIAGAGFRFFAWDSEWTLEEIDVNVVNFHNGTDNPARIFQKLKANADFRMLVADRIHRHFFHGGAMTPEASIARYAKLAETLDRAIVGESARWGDTRSSRPRTRDADWVPERDRILYQYLPFRTEIALQQLCEAKLYPDLPAPELSQHGGEVEYGFQLTMSIADKTGRPAKRVRLVDIADAWRYEQSGTDLGTEWRSPGYDDWTWRSGKALLYVENSSLPAPKNTPLTLGQITYYFRKRFRLDSNIDLKNAELELNTIINDGAVIYLNGVELMRLGMPDGTVEHSTFANRTVTDAVFEGPFTVPADHLIAGSNVLAVEVHQTNASSIDIVFGLTLDAVEPSSGGPAGALPIYYTLDGADPRLPGGHLNAEKALAYAGPVTLTENVHIKARTYDGGTWSALNEAFFIIKGAPAEIDAWVNY